MSGRKTKKPAPTTCWDCGASMAVREFLTTDHDGRKRPIVWLACERISEDPRGVPADHSAWDANHLLEQGFDLPDEMRQMGFDR